jgi:D-amino-acid dehydrogenase
MQEEPWSFAFAQNGKLVLCPDLQTLQRQEAQVQVQGGAGLRSTGSDASAVLAARARAGGLGRPPSPAESGPADECVADPYLLCRELVRSLRRMGGQNVIQHARDLVCAPGPSLPGGQGGQP